MSSDSENESSAEEEVPVKTSKKTTSKKTTKTTKMEDTKKQVKTQEDAEEKDASGKEKEKEEDTSAVVTTSTFASLGVCEPLCEACNKSGWSTATRIQKEVLPYAFQGRDVIGLAETGSGYVYSVVFWLMLMYIFYVVAIFNRRRI